MRDITDALRHKRYVYACTLIRSRATRRVDAVNEKSEIEKCENSDDHFKMDSSDCH